MRLMILGLRVVPLTTAAFLVRAVVTTTPLALAMAMRLT